LLFGASDASLARSGDRTLKLYFGHTGEHGTFTFRKNGRYDRSELKRLNHFLRDWRRNEPTEMDPRLFDLIWEVYQEVGATGEISVVSAYRSLKTNNMLRSRSSGVAKRSQHTLGKAMDFYIPGVPLNKLRAAALKKQVGGVGYYPTSGSPFVHLDVGSVRHWPRMTRKQLIALFPDGKTLHIPSDGKPLSGYQTVLARYGRGGRKDSLGTVAYADASGSGRRERTTVVSWLNNVFSDDEEEAADNSAPETAATATARARQEAPPQAPQVPAPAERGTVLASAGPVDLMPDVPALLPRAAPSEIRASQVETVQVATADDQSPALDPSDSLALMAYAGLPHARPQGFSLASAETDAPAQGSELTALYERALAEADPATAAPTERGAIAGLILASAVGEPPAAGLPRTLDTPRPVAMASLAGASPAGASPAGASPVGDATGEPANPFQAIEAAAGPAGAKNAREPSPTGSTLAYATPDPRPEPDNSLRLAQAGNAAGQPAPLSLAAAIAQNSGETAAEGSRPRLITQRPDPGALSRLMGKDTTRTFIFALLQAPRPTGATEFFAIPVSGSAARALSAPKPLRTDRFSANDDFAALDEPDQVHLLIASLR